MDRSIEMVISILAILKSGAAYVPLDPKYPVERNRYIINDSATCAVLVDRNTCESFPEKNVKIVNLDEGQERWSELPSDNLEDFACEDEGKKIAYYIYTVDQRGLLSSIGILAQCFYGQKDSTKMNGWTGYWHQHLFVLMCLFGRYLHP
jgi:non-ribosomal peptide synthetase component F